MKKISKVIQNSIPIQIIILAILGSILSGLLLIKPIRIVLTILAGSYWLYQSIKHI